MKVDLRLDTTALLESMVEQARLVVFKAVARATPGAGDKTKRVKGGEPAERDTSTFRSALNLSAADAEKSTRLQKARSSALRLNSILQDKSDGNPAPLSKTRKTRSVQWESPLDLPAKDANNFPSAKRQRFVSSQARLRSMKSFGRPHADRSHGPKNATFNDFGRNVGVAGGPTWGRDGKLRNHPVPGGGMPQSRLSGLQPGGNWQSSSQNATFDLSAPRPKTRISAGLSQSLNFSKRSAAQKIGIGGLPSTLPRTATALESWLVNKSQGS